MLVKHSYLLPLQLLLSLSILILADDSAIRNLCSPGNSTKKSSASDASSVETRAVSARRSQHGDRLFSKWTNWSPCRSCVSKRFRWCKFPARCQTRIEQEEAFCFVKDSFCYKWIYEQVCVPHYDEEDDYQDYYDEYEEGDESDSSEELEEDSKDDRRQTCGVFQTKNSALTRIIGGHPSKKGHWPWQVAVLNKHKKPFCGGTLIGKQWVLTAAHCVRKTLYIRINEHNLVRKEGNEVEIKVLQSIMHHQYDVDTVDNDLAVLKIKEVPLHQSLACLPHSTEKPPKNQLCTMIGWGKKKASDLEGTEVLHQTEVFVLPDEKCREMYSNYHITENMFCAGHPSRRDSCAGDSGGPLLCLVEDRWTVFGVTSFGEGCGKKGKFGVYTLVPNYIEWIDKVINYY